MGWLAASAEAQSAISCTSGSIRLQHEQVTSISIERGGIVYVPSRRSVVNSLTAERRCTLEGFGGTRVLSGAVAEYTFRQVFLPDGGSYLSQLPISSVARDALQKDNKTKDEK